jgi:dTDP-glucose 4,6-dehydratase
MRTYCVLGGNGVFGVHMVSYLLRNVPDARVIGVGRNLEKPPVFSLHRGIADERFVYHQIHIGFEPERLLELFDATRPEVVINIAAQGEGAASWKSSWRFYDTNATALARIVEPLVGVQWLRKWVQIGSSEVYGSVTTPSPEDAPIRPSTPYSVSKAAADMHLTVLHRVRGFPMNVLRPSNAYGSGQQLHRIVPKTILCALFGRRLPLQGGGLAEKSYIHVHDLSHAIYLVAENAPAGEIYNAGPPESIAIRTLVEMVCAKTGVPFEQVVEIAPDRLGQDARYLLDSRKILHDLGWEPKVRLSEGLDETIAWAKKYADELKGLPTDFTLKA